jgi:hypothetical protein
MIRKTLIGLAAAATAVIGASAANATSYGSYYGGHDSYNDNYNFYQEAGYYHCHRVKKIIKIIVGYDYYGNPIYRYKKVWRKYCHSKSHGY